MNVPAGPVEGFTARAVAAVNRERAKLGLAAIEAISIQNGKNGPWLPSDDWAHAWAKAHAKDGKPASKMPVIPLTYTTDEERAKAARKVLATVDVPMPDLPPIDMPDIPVQDTIVLQGTTGDDAGASPGDPYHAAWQDGYDTGLADPLGGQFSVKGMLRYRGPELQAYENGLKAGAKAAAALPAVTPLPDGKDGQGKGKNKVGIGGLPTFRYNFPRAPLLHRVLSGPAGDLLIELSLSGSITITFAEPPMGVSLNVDDMSWRAEALKALGPVSAGIRINGIGGEAPGIGAVSQNALTFQRQETRFTPPNTVSYTGQVAISYKVRTDLGPVEVRGGGDVQPGYVLSLTFTPRPPSLAPSRVPVTVPEPSAIRSLGQFMEAHGAEITATAAVVGIIVLAIATDGAGLVLLAAV